MAKKWFRLKLTRFLISTIAAGLTLATLAMPVLANEGPQSVPVEIGIASPFKGTVPRQRASSAMLTRR